MKKLIHVIIFSLCGSVVMSAHAKKNQNRETVEHAALFLLQQKVELRDAVESGKARVFKLRVVQPTSEFLRENGQNLLTADKKYPGCNKAVSAYGTYIASVEAVFFSAFKSPGDMARLNRHEAEFNSAYPACAKWYR